MPAKNDSIRIVFKVGLVLAVVVVLAGVVFFKFRDTAAVAEVERGTAIDAVPGSVVVSADRGLRSLVSEAEGKVVWCDPLEAGQHFKQSDILLKLDTTELDRQIAEASRNYADAQKRLEIVFAGKPEWKAARQKLDEAIQAQKLGGGSAGEVARRQDELDAVVRVINPQRIAAEKNLTNARRLHELDRLSDVELKAAEDNLEAINIALRLGDYDAAQARQAHELAMENLQRQREKMTILAPTDGVINDSSMWKGALVNRGTTVAMFFSDDRVVEAKISEDDFSKVKVGQPAIVSLVIYAGQPPFEAKVSKILPTAEPETQRYTVYLDVTVDRSKLVPNSNGQVNITVGEHKDVLLIPRRAVFDGNNVCVVKDGRVEVRTVKLGYVSLNKVEVAEGLAPGEHVVVENVRDFRHGQFVRLEQLK